MGKSGGRGGGKSGGNGKGGSRRKRQPKKTFGGNIAIFAIAVGLAALVLLATPVLLIACVGLIPTFVAALVDRDPERNTSIAVGSLNVAGITPYVAALFAGPLSFNHAIDQLMDVTTWLVIYGSAGLGYLFILAIPPVTTAYLNGLAASRMQRLQRDQKQLIESWGDEVSHHRIPTMERAQKKT